MAKKRKGQQATDDRASKKSKQEHTDLSNAEIIDPAEQKRRKAEAAERRKYEASADKPMSKKKQKRLDAFIRRKLKKEDTQQLIASLAKTQVSNLDLQSSSSLGSKQFKSANDKLKHAQAVEDSHRSRARAVLDRVKKQGYLSDEPDDDGDASDEEDATEGARKDSDSPAAANGHRTAQTTASHKKPFNPSGAVQVEIAKPKAPSSNTTASTSVETKAGSALLAGASVQVVKRKPKERGYLRALAGKAKAEESAGESEDSFDSSDAANDSDGSEESWHGMGGSSDESGSDDDDDAQEDHEAGKEAENARHDTSKSGGDFRAWADEQLRTAAGDSPSQLLANDPHDDGEYRPLFPPGSGQRQTADPSGLTGPLGEHLPASETPAMPPQRTTFVKINRTAEIEEQRMELPVAKEEDRIMTAIRGNPVVVVCGETGSGKTTQIGQFLWEAGFGDPSSDNPGMIAITQPRRVAALSTSARVRSEMNLPASSSQVAHRIRYSSTTSADTRLVFMTDGVLLRELANDFLLSKYSIVVIDEAHERGVNTDVLIGVLSRVARLRESMWRSGKDETKPLRLVIMSATLRVSDFAENKQLFPIAPPIIEVSARQHPVTVHFSRKTPHNYIDEAFKKVARIHARLPPGGVLVFCTGQNEIMTLVRKLEKKFGPAAVKARKARIAHAGKVNGRGRSDEQHETAVDQELARDEIRGDDVEVEDIDIDVGDDQDLAADIDDGIVESDPEDLEDDHDEDVTLDEEDTDEPMTVLPLYSLLATDKQLKVFQPPPEGTRLVIVATNVAETSITIPNIRYVVDSGRAKERRYDPASGVQSFEVSWISKASAAQRAGRAGRTGPGHCYRLYSSAAFEQYFDAFSEPEILRMPIEGVVLQMKSMNIDAVVNFPFPTPPDRLGLQRAEQTLANIGALEKFDRASATSSPRITELGRTMAMFPLSPRFAKMVIAGQTNGCLPYVIAIVCALTVGDPFIREANIADDEQDVAPQAEQAMSSAEVSMIKDPELRAKEERRLMRKSYFVKQAQFAKLGSGSSDVFKLLSVVGAYEFDKSKEAFCQANFVRAKAMDEIHKLRGQISQIVRSVLTDADAGSSPQLKPPSDAQLKVLRQLILAAFVDQVAIRADLLDKSNGVSYARTESSRGVPYKAFDLGEEDAFIHPSSVLFHQSPPPEFVVYQEVHRTSKIWLKTLTKINPAWLPVIGKRMCTFSKPLEDPATSASRTTKTSENERKIFVVPRFGPGQGVELKPIQVTQRLVNGRWITAS